MRTQTLDREPRAISVAWVLRWTMAVLMLGAAGIHFAAMGEHAGVSWTHGLFFGVHRVGAGDARRAPRTRTGAPFDPGDDPVQLRGDRRVARVPHRRHRHRHRRHPRVGRVRRRAVRGVRGGRHRARPGVHLWRGRAPAHPPRRGLGHRWFRRRRRHRAVQLRVQPRDRRQQRRRRSHARRRGRRRRAGHRRGERDAHARPRLDRLERGHGPERPRDPGGQGPGRRRGGAARRAARRSDPRRAATAARRRTRHRDALPDARQRGRRGLPPHRRVRPREWRALRRRVRRDLRRVRSVEAAGADLRRHEPDLTDGRPHVLRDGRHRPRRVRGPERPLAPSQQRLHAAGPRSCRRPTRTSPRRSARRSAGSS